MEVIPNVETEVDNNFLITIMLVEEVKKCCFWFECIWSSRARWVLGSFLPIFWNIVTNDV